MLAVHKGVAMRIRRQADKVEGVLAAETKMHRASKHRGRAGEPEGTKAPAAGDTPADKIEKKANPMPNALGDWRRIRIHGGSSLSTRG